MKVSPQAINCLMHLNYFFFLIVLDFVRITVGHNSRLYTLIYKVSGTEEGMKNTHGSPSPVTFMANELQLQVRHKCCGIICASLLI